MNFSLTRIRLISWVTVSIGLSTSLFLEQAWRIHFEVCFFPKIAASNGFPTDVSISECPVNKTESETCTTSTGLNRVLGAPILKWVLLWKGIRNTVFQIPLDWRDSLAVHCRRILLRAYSVQVMRVCGGRSPLRGIVWSLAVLTLYIRHPFLKNLLVHGAYLCLFFGDCSLPGLWLRFLPLKRLWGFFPL